MKIPVKAIIHSFRLRTLPLSVSGAIVATKTSVWSGDFRWNVCLFLFLTVLSLQILSNLCNELGDWRRGTDRDQSARPSFSLQQGQLSEKALVMVIRIIALFATIMGSLLVYSSFKTLISTEALIFLLCGAVAIIAAIFYTLGKRPYGYHAGGDLSVFVFFGLFSVVGSHYLYVHDFLWQMLLPSCSFGFFIVGVLNTNNIRDIEGDRRHNKKTIASLLGNRWAKIYETILVVGGIALLAVYTLCWRDGGTWWRWLWLLSLPLFFQHLRLLWLKDGADLDKSFQFLVPATILSAVLLG